VLITGAAGAIGAALARVMRAAWPSARLALLDRDAVALQPLVTELGQATAHGVDLRDLSALPALVEQLGDLDGLVNCAGVMWVQSVATVPWESASDLLTIDLLAPLRLQELVVAGLVRRQRGGFVVNVSSMAGKVPLKGCAYYGAAKAGLAMASEVARADLAPHGIRVVTVYPGPVKSALEQGAREAYGQADWFGGYAPTGDPADLARRVLSAVQRDEARVIYPLPYAFGWVAPNVSRWIALGFGPTPTT